MNTDIEKQLETLFLQATHEPAFRAEFLKKLLDSNIYFPGSTGHADLQQVEEVYLKEATPLQIKSWPNEEYGQVIPFFTSLDKMRLTLDSNENFICMSCKVFFTMTLGSLLILNPESDASKEFNPEEISDLLENGVVNNQQTFEVGTQIRLGQPAEYPEYMLEQMKKYFSIQKHVSKAYLAQMHMEGEQPSLIVGVMLSEKLNEIIEQKLNREMSALIQDTLQPIRPIALAFFDENTSGSVVEEYLKNETEPFYVKLKEKKKGFFAKLFS